MNIDYAMADGIPVSRQLPEAVQIAVRYLIAALKDRRDLQWVFSMSSMRGMRIDQPRASR